MKQVIFSFAFLLCFNPFTNFLLAQDDTTATSTHSTLTFGAEYTSNNSELGSVSSYGSQPSYQGSISYKGKKGLGLQFAPNYVGNSDSTNTKFSSEYDLGASYTLWSGKPFSITPSYSHLWHSQNSTTLKSAINNDLQIASTLTLNWWTASLTTEYDWGQTHDITLSPATNATIDLNNVLGQDNTLEFQPTIGLTLNRNALQNFNNKKKTRGLTDFLKLYPNITVSEFLTSTDPVIVEWRNAHPAVVSSISTRYSKIESKNSKKQKSNILLSDLLAGRTKFGLTAINLSLPVSYSVKDFTFSANFQYNIPNSKIDPATFYMSFGITYSFGL